MKPQIRIPRIEVVALLLLLVAPASASVAITSLNLLGETVTFVNTGPSPVDMTRWTLTDQGAKHTYTFPIFTLAPGASVTVHTGLGANTATDLFWGRRLPVFGVWDNEGDVATLADASRAKVADFAGSQISTPSPVLTLLPVSLQTTIPGGATYALARSYYVSAATVWSQAWGASDLSLIRQYLYQAKFEYSKALNTASQTNDPANAANLALVASVSTAYSDLADAAIAMYDGSDVYSAGRSQMDSGRYTAAAASFQAAAGKFGSSQTLFGQATTTLQSVSYVGSEYGDGTAYTALIVPLLTGKTVYLGEFSAYAQGWEHTALAYQASAVGDRTVFQSEGRQAMNLFNGLRSSSAFGEDATKNYNVLVGLIGDEGTIPSTTQPTVIPTTQSGGVPTTLQTAAPTTIQTATTTTIKTVIPTTKPTTVKTTIVQPVTTSPQTTAPPVTIFPTDTTTLPTVVPTTADTVPEPTIY